MVRDIHSAASVDASYADNFHAAESAVSPVDIAASLSTAAHCLLSQALDHGLSLSAPKSTVTLFMPWTKQVGRLPPVSVGGDVIPQENHPKLLGVTFDPTLCFSSHAMAAVRKTSSRVNVLRSLADSSFGHDKECLTATFKAIIRPFFHFAAPVVYPQYSPSSLLRSNVSRTALSVTLLAPIRLYPLTISTLKRTFLQLSRTLDSSPLISSPVRSSQVIRPTSQFYCLRVRDQ